MTAAPARLVGALCAAPSADVSHNRARREGRATSLRAKAPAIRRNALHRADLHCERDRNRWFDPAVLRGSAESVNLRHDLAQASVTGSAAASRPGANGISG